MNNFYIDESGNTGDVTKTGKSYSFGSQPLFTLSAIGIDRIDKLENKVKQLKNKYKIQQKELKSTKIYKNHPGFISELVDFIISSKLPFFIEVVDKKYFICTNIVNCVVYPPYYCENNQDTLAVRNIFSDFIYEKNSNIIYDGFVDCCLNPSEETVLSYMDTIKFFFEKYAQIYPDKDNISYFIMKSIEESLDDFRLIKEKENEEAYKRFIPIPDENKSGKDVWLLPNLSSFNSIYARLNKYKSRKLSKVSIYHDEQSQFDEIIKNIHSSLTSWDYLDNMAVHCGDYNFEEEAKLEFIDSKSNIAVQVADVLSGFIMRYIQDSLYGDNDINDHLIKAFNKLKKSWDTDTNVGINFVIPHYQLSNI